MTCHVDDIQRKAEALAKETERRRKAALERNIQLREAEQKRRQQIRQESAGKKRKPAEKRDGRWPPGGQRSRSDVGSSGSENEWASRGGSKRSSRTPSPGFHGLITLPAPPSAAPGGAAASAAETCDDEDGKAPPSRPSSGMVTIGRGSPRSDKRRQLFHSALDEGDGDETGEEDDLDRAIIHSARGDSPPAVLTHPVGFEAESPRPRSPALQKRRESGPSSVRSCSSTWTSRPSSPGKSRPASRQSRVSTGSRKSIVGKVEVVQREHRKWRMVRGTYVELDNSTSVEEFRAAPADAGSLNTSRPASPEERDDGKAQGILQQGHLQPPAIPVPTPGDRSRPTSVRFSRTAQQATETPRSSWDFNTFSILELSSEEAGLGERQRPYSATILKARRPSTGRNRPASARLSSCSWEQPETEEGRNNGAAFGREPERPSLSIPMQPWRSASQVKEKEPAKAAARRPKQRGKREPTSGNRPSAPSSVVAPPSPESASLLLARVETMLREESARRTDDRGFFHLRPILSRHSSAPSFSMRKALGMLPGDQTWAAAEDRLARARYSAMPPKWVAAERKREAEINAGVVNSAGGTHGPRLPPLFPSRIPRWRSAPGKVGFPSKERTERIGVSPFHIPPARRQKEGEPGPVKQREALLGLREGDFGELDESLGAFLLAERLCLHDHLSPDDVVRVLNDDIGRRRSTVVQSLGQVQVRPSSTFLERASPTVQASPSEDHLHRHLQSNFQLALRHYRGPREGSTGSARARRKSSAQEGRSPTPVKPNPSHGIAARERRRARSCRSARPGAAGSTGERMPKSRARGHDGTSAGKSPDAGPFEKRSPQHVPAPPSTVPPPRQRRRASRADADSAAASGHVRQADAAPPLQTPDVQTASRPWHGGRADDRGALDVSIAAAEEVLEATINSLSEQLRARGIERELLSQASPTRAYQTAPQVLPAVPATNPAAFVGSKAQLQKSLPLSFGSVATAVEPASFFA